MKPLDVLYFVEHRDRELDVAAVVAADLESRFGRSVRIVPIAYGSQKSLWRYSPTLIVTPFLPSAQTYPLDLFWDVHGENLRYVNLGFEQLLVDLFTYSHVPRDRLSREVALHFCWNARYREWLLSKGVPVSHAPLTGSPQHAFYLPRYRPLLPSRKELAEAHDLDPSRQWLLFPLNFGGAFYGEAGKEGMKRKGLPPDLLDSYIEFCNHSFEDVTRWVLHVARLRKESVFIIRPRPLEDPESYSDRMKRIGTVPGNVRIIKEGPVRNWIVNSDLVLSSYSTTLLEAALAGKTAYSMLPLPLPDWLTNDWNPLIPKIQGPEALLAAVDGSSEQDMGPARAYAEERFGMHDGDPLSRVAESIEEALRAPKQPPPEDGARRRVRRLWRDMARESIKELLVRNKVTVPGIELRSTYDYFTAREVDARIRTVASAVGGPRRSEELG